MWEHVPRATTITRPKMETSHIFDSHTRHPKIEVSQVHPILDLVDSITQTSHQGKNETVLRDVVVYIKYRKTN